MGGAKNVGARLRAARVARGLSINRLAQMSGVSGAQISRIERGKRGATVATATAIASAMHADLAWILTGDDATELQRAVAFLRGELPDAYLDEVLATYSGGGWGRDALVAMIRMGSEKKS